MRVSERLSYDAHGKRRHATGYGDMSNLLTSQITTRGFTGHEHLDGVDLIHMNGRVYDPHLGRFLTADPTVQYPDSTQGLNRYSYVENNPLSFTDPSGFGFLKSVAKLFVPILNKALRPFIAIAVGFTPGVNVFALGFISGVIAGGDLKSGIIGAFTAGAFQAVGNLGYAAGSFKNIVAHGIVGGVSSVAQGGKFGSGFLAGAFGEYAVGKIQGFKLGLAGSTIAASVAGGIGSVLGGGKFGNGAITGAFGYLFNHFLHRGVSDDSGPKKTDAELELGATDGDITLEDANYNYANKNGRSLSVSLSTIDLSGIQASEFVDNPQTFNLVDPRYFGSLSDALVYGNLRLDLLPNNTVRATRGYDDYDFDIQKPYTFSNTPRNVEAFIGGVVAGRGTPFRINIRGTVAIQP